jgi:hypothetical protein
MHSTLSHRPKTYVPGGNRHKVRTTNTILYSHLPAPLSRAGLASTWAVEHLLPCLWMVVGWSACAITMEQQLLGASQFQTCEYLLQRLRKPIESAYEQEHDQAYFRTLVRKPARAKQLGQGPHVCNRRDTRERSGMHTLIKFINIMMKTKNANAGATPAAIAATRVYTTVSTLPTPSTRNKNSIQRPCNHT